MGFASTPNGAFAARSAAKLPAHTLSRAEPVFQLLESIAKTQSRQYTLHMVTFARRPRCTQPLNVALVRMLVATVVLLATGCARHAALYLRQELANQGPVPLSQRNPYIAGNLFIAREMQHSNVFDGFIRNRGTPDAVEVKEGYFRPLRVYLFYLTEGEAYLFEESSGDWLVRGPEHIPAQMMRSFLNIQPSGGSAPLAVEGYSEGSGLPQAKPSAADEVRSLRHVPTRAEATKRRSETKSPAAAAPTPRAPVPPPSAPASAEESSSGDVIHRVTLPGENLRIIAQWYTGDVNNTGRIARINGIEKPDRLTMSQTIRIPRYLLRTTEPLPPSAITPLPGVQERPPRAPVDAPVPHQPNHPRNVTIEDAPLPGAE